MKITETNLSGCMLIHNVRFHDHRGSFQELYLQQRYQAACIGEPLIQDNLSISAKSVIRGLHFQHQQPQGKLITVLSGAIYDVMLDIRPTSPTMGQWQAIELSADNPQQLWIPPGLAHSFQALTENIMVLCKTSSYYNPKNEGAFYPLDLKLNIAWPITPAILSEKDYQAAQYSVPVST